MTSAGDSNGSTPRNQQGAAAGTTGAGSAFLVTLAMAQFPWIVLDAMRRRRTVGRGHRACRRGDDFAVALIGAPIRLSSLLVGAFC